MKTLNQFFKINKDKLPVSYATFKNKILKESDIETLEKNGIIYVMGGDKRKVIKVMNDDEFVKYFFNKAK